MKDTPRLLKYLDPQNYDLFVDIDFKNGTFRGVLELHAQIKEPAQSLYLHANELEIVKSHVKSNDRAYKTETVSYSKEKQQVTLNFAEKIPAGVATIHITYTGQCSNDMLGFYKSTYSRGETTDQVLSTQFESHYARRVFPCIDEPSAKATFDLTLSVNDKNVDIIANTPVKSSHESESKQKVTFETSPLMSTYLLAWAVGDFEYLETTSKNGTRIRTYATPDNVEKTEFVLEISKKILSYYEDYFDIEYPLEKLDLIGIPEFSAGAMENWGLVTFREEAFLVDEGHTSVTTKQFIAKVVAHELAHQWFGNLVTMSWWNDLWLNEGFASWVEYLAVDHIFPEWEIWTEFISSDWDSALQLDSLWNTHPIEVPIHNPNEINEIFDAISYQKGAAAIRMLHDFVGKDAFQTGLRNYLNQHSYSNTTTDDLWQALEGASSKPVKQFMHSWTQQAGFPLISYERQKKNLTVQQSRFIMSPLERNARNDNTVWPVQLTSQKGNELYFTNKTQNWSVSNASHPKLNNKQVGLYRVQYTSKDIQVLANQIKARELEAIERMGVLSDVFAITRAGYSRLGTFFDLLKHYTHEDEQVVWDVISYAMNITWRTFDDEASRNFLHKTFENVLTHNYHQISWQPSEDDSHAERLMRNTILALSMKFDVQDARSKAVDEFNSSFNESSIHPDIRRSIYVTAARELGSKTYAKFLKTYTSETSFEERGRLANALAAIDDSQIIQDNLSMLKTDKVRLQEVIYWLAYLLNNVNAKELTWEWIKSNWDWLQDNFGSGSSMSHIPKLVGRVFSDQTNIEDMDDFFSTVDTDNIERSVKQSIETAYINLEWKKREEFTN